MFNKIGHTKKNLSLIKTYSFSILGKKPGLHVRDDVFYKINNNNKVDWIISRTCDHAGGRLMYNPRLLGDCTAKCPNHGWTLDLKKLKYKNVNVRKKKLKFIQNKNKIIYQDNKHFVDLPKKIKNNNPIVKIRFLAHACMSIDIDGFKIVTDPWLIGPCFNNGWWHLYPPKNDAVNILKEADLIYISHNHPDHLHPETLQYIKNKKIITPNFKSKSSEKMLSAIGCTKIEVLNFQDVFEIKSKNIFFTIFKSGDFRDDSGLYIKSGKFSILLAVDSRFLNGGNLPKNTTVFMSSFAAGATGFPLCFLNYSENEKKKIKKTTKIAKLLEIEMMLKKLNSKFFIPYAGFFSESASRDKYIKKKNFKNSIDDVKKRLSKTIAIVNVCDPINFDEYIFRGNKLIEKKYIKKKKLYKINQNYISSYIRFTKKTYNKINEERITKYFYNSKFKDKLKLFLQLTNDNFVPTGTGFLIDFSNSKIKIRKISNSVLEKLFNKYREEDNINYLNLKIRKESLHMTIDNFLPFEDLLIGFQCRVRRLPNLYNNRFWYHFTNIYIAKEHFRSDKICFGCDPLFQTVLNL